MCKEIQQPDMAYIAGRKKAEGRRQKAEGRRQKAQSSRLKAKRNPALRGTQDTRDIVFSVKSLARPNGFIRADVKR
jgi:hypothetical protein